MPRTPHVITTRHTEVPVSVRHADLLTAMQPFYDLLGVGGDEIFDDGGLVVGRDFITFTAIPQVADRHARKLEATVVGDDCETSEHAVKVKIAVDH